MNNFSMSIIQNYKLIIHIHKNLGLIRFLKNILF
jgi:hypothetical protein